MRVEDSIRVNIVGIGKVSSSIARQLKGKVQFGYIVSRDLEKAKLLSQELGALAAAYNDNFVLNGAVLVGLNDSSLPDLPHLLEKNMDYISKETVFIHFSGFHPSNIFPIDWNPVSMHPNCAVANPFTSFEGVVFGIEGSSKGLNFAKKIVTLLNGKYVLINTEKKAMYHLAAVVVSNFPVALAYLSLLMYKEVGIEENISKEIIYKLLESVNKNIKNHTLKDALTGPIKRNDWFVVEKEKRIFEEFISSQGLSCPSLYSDLVNLLLEIVEAPLK
ncbi:MAG: DUF2520 domain-containing protein, partial [Fervidobacterium sp.]